MTFNSYSHQVVKKSASSTKPYENNQHLIIREAKSFTETTENFKSHNLRDTNEKIINGYNNESLLQNKISSKGFETREVLSNQIFFVREKMLTYRGNHYSFNDIAINWKKDCRMWLWKCKKPKLKMKQLREQMQNLKM
ncbi:hypothetical protein RI129_004882 [Pyrocoelia pectoralis]|uniref:Uncharacterized protein n=1 Tax=Pyrocoelia pectoralis TaxID=417401 RepID=A0AAN7ZR53_9COLE